MDDEALRKHLEKRLPGLVAERQGYDGHWRDIASYCQPRRSRFLNGGGTGGITSATWAEINKGDRRNTKIYNSRGIWASGVLAGGMTSGLTSPSRPWFTLGTADEQLAENDAVKTWLQDVQARMYAFFARTNFYEASKAGYLESGLFGTEATIMLEHPRHGAVCHSLTAGEYWIALDDALKPDTLYRRCPMTVAQVVERFGLDKVSRKVREAYDASRYDEWTAVMHAIEPNRDRDASKKDMRNKPWRSVYWEPGATTDDGRQLLSVSGTSDQPFWAMRWDTCGAEVYGSSPGMNALPDVQQLQVSALRKAQGIEHMFKPALSGPVLGDNPYPNLNPGQVTFIPSSNGPARFEPIWQVSPQAINAMREDIQEVEQSCDRHFYADLFMSITNMPGIQPRNVEEIARRNDEKMTQLGPVVERAFNEKLKVAIDRAFAILLRTGQLPPAPKEIAGQELKIKFVSVLAQMQQLVGLGSIERTLGFVGNLLAVSPSSADKIDFDQTVDEYASIAGAPARMIRSDDAVAAMRKAREAQENAAKAAAFAQPMQQGADAARLLSETDVGGGQSMLQRLAGG